MEFRRCMPPCMRFIAREDPHSKCILCLGFSHAREAVYGTSNCKICDDFRLITLRSRLEDYERESSNFSRRASSTNAPPREIAASREAAASRRAASWGSDVELDEMESEQTGLAFSLPPSPDRARANSPVKFLTDFQFPSPKARDFVSFGLDDILHTAASDSEDFGPASADALPPNGQEARPSAAYSKLVDVLSRATEKLALDWPNEPRESRASKFDDRFLIGAHSKLERRKLPFFSDLHREISSSWKQPFSSRLTNAAAADFANLVGSVEQGYTTMPVIEETLASHLSPSLAPSWKSRPLLPSKPCRTTSALIGKSYIAAGQAGMALHTMAILQAYQADVLKEMDEGTGLTPEAVKELRRATDLALRATKHTARAVGRSMAASVAAERHLWLNLTEIREKEKVFLMDAPISRSGLFGEAVSAVVDKFRSAKTQSAALKQFMPRRARDFSTPSSSVSREQPLPRREPPSSGAQATRPPPTTVWGARGRSSSRQQPRKRVNMKRPNKPAASAETPVNVARPRLSPERGENGCDPPSPYDHNGRINDRLGRGLRRKAGEWRVEGRVPLLAYKLPGTQGCLPGFEVFSPRSRGASCHSQDGQYGGCVPHKPPRRFKVAHPGQACAPSSPLVPRQVPLFEGGSRSGSTEPGGRFYVETEAQARGMDVEPSDRIPDLGSVWQSGGGPLCFSRVIPVPALVLPEIPDDSRHRCVRPPMAECQSVRVSANKADSGSTMQSEGERCPSPSHSPILALPDLVLGAKSPLVSTSLGDSDQAGLTVPASGQDLASSAGALEVVGMAHTGPRAVIDGLPAEVQETIASARAPATRKLYSSKWGVFESWCLTRAIDPVNCPVGPVLEFLQERLTAGAAATTLRVYVAAIAAQRELDEIPLGRHRLVSAFMRGARRLRPVRPTAVPSWDLSVVLEGLVTAPFEPLESASDRILTLKVVLLLALTSLKRVGDLQAFSVSETCMDFAPGLVKVTLRPRPGYIPKVLSTSFRSQVVTLHSFHPPPFASSEDERLHMLCPVRALKLYVDRSKVWRRSPQLLICFGAGRRGLATSKQRISHWVRDAISLAYEARELPSPLSLRAHSTRGVASSQALFRGVPLEDICVAAGWSSPHTFVRFYNLDVDTAPGSQVLSV